MALAELVAFGVARLGPWGGLAFSRAARAARLARAGSIRSLRRVGAFDVPRPAALLLGLAVGGFLGATCSSPRH